MKKTALVTGGAGFIGSHLVDLLLDQGWAVTVVDNFDPFYDVGVKRSNLASHKDDPLLRVVEEDIRNMAALRSKLGSYDVLVHLAARAGVRPSIQDPVGYQEINVAGTQNMLEFARERGIGQFIFASSSSVYGINPDVPWREDDHVLLPISPYASTKVSGELMGHVYSHLYGIRFLALRFFTVYGPRQRPDLAIHKFARLIENDLPIPFYGDGTSKRDYTYVGDVVRGIRAAMDYNGSSYEIVNIGNDRTVSLAGMVLALEKAIGKRAELDPRPDQPGDVPQTWADIKKAGALLGYCPATSFDDGIRRQLDWLRG